jgi:hypothetical protein
MKTTQSPARMIAGWTGQVVIAILGGSLLLSCVDHPTAFDPYEEMVVAQLLLNSDVEEGYLWQDTWTTGISVAGDTTIQFDWTEEESASPSHSLKMSASSFTSEGSFGYWSQIVGLQPGQYAGATLEFSTSILLDEVLGTGVSILLSAYDESMNPVGAVGTQFAEVIRGSHWWREYSVRLPDLSADAHTLYVYLVYLSETRGAAYFDDIELKVIELTGF